METPASRFQWFRPERRTGAEPRENAADKRTGPREKGPDQISGGESDKKVPDNRTAKEMTPDKRAVTEPKEREPERKNGGEVKKKVFHWGTAGEPRVKEPLRITGGGEPKEKVLDKRTSGESKEMSPDKRTTVESMEEVLKEKVPKEKVPKEKVPMDKAPKDKVSDRRTKEEPIEKTPRKRSGAEFKDKVLHWRTSVELKEKVPDKKPPTEPKEKVPDQMNGGEPKEKAPEKRTAAEPKERVPKEKVPKEKVPKEKCLERRSEGEPQEKRTLGESREKRSLVFKEFTRGFSHLALRTSLKRRLRRRHTQLQNRPLSSTRTLTVSDGDLNMAPEERSGGAELSHASGGSNTSLPTVPGAGAGSSGVGAVASWAVSFERLLEDPAGVVYFTAFLKSEVSAENILFWQACEKFRHIPANHTDKLNQEARSIYGSFLSASARNSVNVDDTVRFEERDLRSPRPDMFYSAQQQIFKLMKFDSYRRFVRSQLFQSCMLANVEGRALPELCAPGRDTRHGDTRHGDTRHGDTRHGDTRKAAEQRTREQGAKVKPGRSPAGAQEEGGERKRGALTNKLTRDKQPDKRGGSWGSELSNPAAAVRAESLNAARQGPYAAGEKPGRVGGAEKYCCVYLPDGTASLAPARPGLSIRSMLIGLCEKRGLPLSDVIIYLQGKAKQPLSLDQDSSVLREQQVYLELMVTLTVELLMTGRTVGVAVKSSKTLQEALAPALKKLCLQPQEVIVTTSGSREALDMNMTVSSLTNKQLTLDRIKDGDQRSASGPAPPGSSPSSSSHAPPEQSRPSTRERRPAARKTYDMDGLMQMLSQAQYCSSVEDQRGLLRREQLSLPDFLQRPLVTEHTLDPPDHPDHPDQGRREEARREDARREDARREERSRIPQTELEEEEEERRRKSENGEMMKSPVPGRAGSEATPTSRNVPNPQGGGVEATVPPPSQSPSLVDPARETVV